MSLGRFLHDALDGLGSYEQEDARHRAWLRTHGRQETALSFRLYRNAERGRRFGVMMAMTNLLGLLFSPWTPTVDDWKRLLAVAVVSMASPRVWAFVGLMLTRVQDDEGDDDPDHPLPGT